MKKTVAVLLVVLSIAVLFCGCGSEKLEIKEFVKDYYEIDAETEAEMIETVTELKRIAEEAETTKDKLNFAESVNEFRSEFSDVFEENIEIAKEKQADETDNDAKEKHFTFLADYNSLGAKALDFFGYATGKIDEEEYFEIAVDYLNDYAKAFFTGFESKDLIEL